MKTIGLIGGITWHSTLDYYRLFNELVHQRLGGVHSAKVLINSVDFAAIKQLTEAEDWEGIATIICKAAQSLQLAGADCIVIGANTMHNIAASIQAAVQIPVIHIGAVTASAIKKAGINRVALLGTKYTMQMDFYKAKLAESGIDTIIPGSTDIAFINNSIYNEFGHGVFLPETKAEYLRIINVLIEAGAEGVILGCTEIPILIKQSDCSVPVFDTAMIHATAAVDFAL